MVALYSDGQLVATALADQLRADITGTTSDDGRHGFRFPLPDSLRDGAAHTLSVRIQGTNYTVGSLTMSAPCPPPAFDGAITSADCNQVTGWAWDSGRPTTPIDVDIYVDDVFRARASADVYNAQLGKGDNRHQFGVPTPLAARDGQPHTIKARPAGSGSNFASAQTVSCAAPSFAGQFDGADCNYLTGWAWDAGRPDVPVSVEVVENGRVVAAALADVQRSDIPTAGGRRHGFQIPLPASLRDGLAHSLELRVSGATASLGSLTSPACPAQPGCPVSQSLASPEFVKNFYVGALSRQPRPPELQYWNDALGAASAQGQAALFEKAQQLGRELFRQGEYAVINSARTTGKEEAYVADLYWAYLQRGPDASGQNWWANIIRNAPAGQDG